MKHKAKRILAVLLISVSVFVLSGCSTSLQGLGSMFNLDLQNSRLNVVLDAGLLGIETASGATDGTGDILFDVQLDWKNKAIRCQVDTDSSGSGDSHLDFFLNWKSKDTLFELDSEYPATEEEKAAGSPDINSLHFDFLMNWQKKNIGSNLNVGPYELHLPLSEGSGNEGENGK